MNKFSKSILKSLYDLLFGNNFLNNLDMIFAVNEFEKEIISDKTDKPIRILPNSIDINNQTITKINFREKYNLPDKKIILFFSRLNQNKNPEMAIDSYLGLSEDLRRDTILVVLGPDDGAGKSLNQIVKSKNLDSKVFIFAELIGDEKWSIYDQCEVLILPTKDQAFPLVMLEAISRNLPVVTSEIALKDVLPQQLGQIVDYEAQSFSRAITNFLLSEKPRDGKDFIEKNYSVVKFVDLLLSYYKEILD